MLKEKLVSLGFHATVVVRSPSLCKKSKVGLLNVQCNFTAIRKNVYFCDTFSYLTSLRVADNSAALLAVIA